MREAPVFRSFRSRLTFANVVSVMALFVALGGSSYAAIKVTGKNVKNSSLTGKDVKNNSLKGSDVTGLGTGDIRDSSLLAQDFKPGQLPAGPRGAPGATNVTLRSTQGDPVAVNAFEHQTVGCKPGEKLVGGGGSWIANGGFNRGGTLSMNSPGNRRRPECACPGSDRKPLDCRG
jgi:hypothetical protein